MSLEYSLDNVDTSDARAVAFALVQVFHEAFPFADSSDIPKITSDTYRMFSGNYEDLLPINTRYHDLEHSLQATLCFTRMMAIRHQAGVRPILTADKFMIGLAAILLHDTGYLKREGDTEGTGAKYTRVHERRSCEYAAHYLSNLGWDNNSIESVQHMISSTGPFSDISAVPFHSDIEYIIGQAVCTADYIGQMSDYAYINKLYGLFMEFEESDNHMRVPKEQRPFQSFEELFQKTPMFWEKIVKPRLYVECNNLWKFLASPYPNGKNDYIDTVLSNLDEVNELIKQKKIPSENGDRVSMAN